jgi:hypothetical protein
MVPVIDHATEAQAVNLQPETQTTSANRQGIGEFFEYANNPRVAFSTLFLGN